MKAQQKIISATQLAQVERNFGYVSFIHHFKNYIIRGTDEYYQKAQNSYKETYQALQTLKKLSANNNDLEVVKTIEETLLEYQRKLQLARQQNHKLPTNQLDRLVKVSDTPAETALNTLRLKILPRLKEQQQITNEKVDQLNQRTVTISLILIPIFMFANFLTVQLIRQLIATTQELSTIFNSSPDTILYVHSDGRILKANKRAEQLFGYSIKELTQLSIEDLIPHELREKHQLLRHKFSQAIQSREMGERDAHIQGITKNGNLVDLHIAIANNNSHDEIRTVCIIKDITRHNELKLAAGTDHLTSVNNRRSFDDALTKELARNIRENNTLSLLMIDLDHFKSLNDDYGHTTGDIALKEVSEYLQQHTRTYDHLARWGGDEFVILCPNLSASSAFKAQTPF